MQFGDDPSISHVANRFMGTGLLRAPLPGKLSRPLLSAMVRAAGGTIRHLAGGVGNSKPVRVLCIRVCFREKSRYALTLMQCRRRRTSSFLRCGPLCQGGTAAEPPLSLLCLPRCSEGMEGDSCRPVAGGRGAFYPLTHLLTAFIALFFCFCTRF